jgi:hypothetical protein
MIYELTIAGAISYTMPAGGGDLYAGGIAGYSAGSGAITQCAVKSTITITTSSSGSTVYAGGIAGKTGDASHGNVISYCSYTGGGITVTSTGSAPNAYVGGIAGYVEGGSVGDIHHCYSTGNISYSGNAANPQIGGIIGSLNYGVAGAIRYCYAQGTITDTGTGAGTHSVGGIAGFKASSLPIENCVALNRKIGAPGTPGRIVSGSTTGLTNNFGLNNMFLNMDDTVGLWVPGSNTQDGLNVSAAQAADPDWWSSDTTDTPPGPHLVIGDDWAWDNANNRPKLFWE